MHACFVCSWFCKITPVIIVAGRHLQEHWDQIFATHQQTLTPQKLKCVDLSAATVAAIHFVSISPSCSSTEHSPSLGGRMAKYASHYKLLQFLVSAMYNYVVYATMQVYVHVEHFSTYTILLCTRSHEWMKHGTCASGIVEMSTEFKFFNTTLGLLQKYNFTSVLESSSITPSNTTTYPVCLQIS